MEALLSSSHDGLTEGDGKDFSHLLVGVKDCNCVAEAVTMNVWQVF